MRLSSQGVYDVLSKYLIDFILKLDNRIQLENERLLNINEVIEYLKNNESDRIYLKLILDQENKYIKKYRPDIVKSWKYYVIFEDIF